MFVIHKRESAVDSTLLILFLGTNYSDYFNIDIKIFQERARAKKKNSRQESSRRLNTAMFKKISYHTPHWATVSI